MARTHALAILLALVAFSFNSVWSGSQKMYDISIVPRYCQKAPPVQSNYTPIGTTFNLGDMEVYETGNSTVNRVLICAYDIFGFHPNTKQVADLLAAEGDYRIVIPDYFRGSPFNASNWPPEDPNEMENFIEERGNWNKTVRNDTLRIIDHYRQTINASSFGIYGFCWGGKISVLAASNLTEIKVAALVHPSSVTTEEANGVNAAMYLMPTQNEPDMIPFYNILKERLGESNCGHRRFDNMFHGFSAARGNFSNPENVRAVDEVISTISSFFSKYV